MRNRGYLLILSFVVLAAAQPGAQNKTIAPTENLVVDGIPAVPASLADDVRRYTESRPANFAGWHPSRRELLISTRFGNTTQVHQVKMPGGARTQLTFFAEPIGGATFEPVQGPLPCAGDRSSRKPVPPLTDRRRTRAASTHRSTGERPAPRADRPRWSACVRAPGAGRASRSSPAIPRRSRPAAARWTACRLDPCREG